MAIADLLRAESWLVHGAGSQEMDLSSMDSVSTYVSRDLASVDLDALVLNAGIFHSASIKNYEWEDWQKVIDINLHGCFRLIKAALPKLLSNPRPNKSIVFISSISADGEPYASAYAASKAALLALSASLAVELASDKIRVNTICPGWVRTDMAKSILRSPAQEQDALGASLTGTWIEPREIAAMTSYLLGETARSITGARFDVDAGL